MPHGLPSDLPPSYQHTLDLLNPQRSQLPSLSPRRVPHGLPYTHVSESLPQNPDPHGSPYSQQWYLPPSHQPPLDQPNSQLSQSPSLSPRRVPHGLPDTMYSMHNFPNSCREELELASGGRTGSNQSSTPLDMKGEKYYLAITWKYTWFRYDLEQTKSESTDTKSVYPGARNNDLDSDSDSDYTDGYESESVIGYWTFVVLYLVLSCLVLSCIVLSCIVLSCCNVSCYVVLFYAMLYCTVLCCNVL